MVSTRQMCGSGAGCGGGSMFEETPTSSRATVVRRTTTNYQQQQQEQEQQEQVASSSSTASSLDVAASQPPLDFLDLPTELIIKTLGYLDYKKISNLRLVSHRMNEICMNMLNATFARQIKTTLKRFQLIKSSMPRRESARRHHPLSCECDIIETCYMRLSLLQMSMGKHIERGHCCFFPGAILDEVHSILNYISITPRLQRPYRVTDELFDLSTMAMEYFKDRIEPTLPGLAYFNKDFLMPAITKRPTLAISSDLSDSANNSPPQNHMVLRKGIRKIKQGMKMYNNQLSVLRNELRTCKRKAGEQSKQLAEQQNLLAEQQKQTLEYANRLDENDKKNEDMSRKFSTLLQELNKCKTELQFWRSKSPAIPLACSSCNQKVSPVLPPEDLQALVNQGVDPENIIIINDEIDADVDANGDGDEGDNANGIPLTVSVNNPFAFPDETTTAKLLAVETAAKNLKRKYAATLAMDTEIANVAVEATSNVIASNATPSNSKVETVAGSAGCGGYSTKLFYGNHQRSGVIVSPVSMKLALLTCNNSAKIAPIVEPNLVESLPVAVVSGTDSSNLGVEQQLESKKARRVQKANRCFNAHGKRSK
ncbi:F-box only protein 28 [Drosophila grimshawi]|uniref:GH22835 n=1 Tax=Drosophila grimshawi TaxID=7222 RepID=B4JW01_DROGR|nr:F-box only protein 28 [Drosophila grimshawi]EDV98139.1 GH22835 [Drosophila grimshawi]